MKIIVFTAVKNCTILHGRVFVMMTNVMRLPGNAHVHNDGINISLMLSNACPLIGSCPLMRLVDSLLNLINDEGV